MRKLCMLLGVLCISGIDGLSIGSPDSSSFIITSRVKRNVGEKESVSTIPIIYEMNVHTNVSNRYAKTLIATKVKNSGGRPQEAQFSVVTPDQAFISGFVMEIEGKKYEAYVQEKEQAKQTYEKAVSEGQAAGHVAVSARDSKRFTVQVNVQPDSKVTFYLTYEELLKRENDKYEIVLNIQPGQPVAKLEATVDIRETRKLKFVDTPPLRTGNEIVRKENEDLKSQAEILMINDTAATVKFRPSIEEQKKFALSLKTDPTNGLQGQFIVEYDVERDPQGGEVLVDEGYFVHFFAPSDLKPLPKKVVFVLDTSGSMSGMRIEQLKGAMYKILDDLKPQDVFSIVEFNWIAKVWNVEKTAVQYDSGPDEQNFFDKNDAEQVFQNRTSQPIPPPFEANSDNTKKAKKVVDKLKAWGGTDIFSALTVALKIVEDTVDSHQPLIIFLTDGEATVGNTNNQEIISNITDSNTGQCPIFAISLGDGADRDFLQKVALKNNAFSKHIYEGADVSLQLEDYYKSISSPLLSNVSFKYVSELPDVKDVTKDKFPILFKGQEVVVVGKRGAAFEPPSVDAWSKDGLVHLIPKVERSAGSLERLWAYLTLKQLLEKKAITESKNITAAALRLALKYSFVSDVTSLVVVKPNATSNQFVDPEDGSLAKMVPYPRPFYSAPPKMASPHGYPSASLGLSGGYGSTSYYNTGSVNRMYSKASVIRHQSSLDRVDSSADLSASFYPIQSFDVDNDYLEQRVFGGQESTTPHLSGVESLKLRIPWLASVLNSNDTITLSSGTYALGTDVSQIQGDSCQNAPNNASDSTCSLLKECSQVYDLITSIEQYEKHMCIIKGYAGVCCTKQHPTV